MTKVQILPSSFWAACAFLTRVPSPVPINETSLAASLRWYPLVGLAVGGLCTLPLSLGLFEGHPTVQGWVYAGLSLWITRGLHWDGLADVLDAWASAATGERFWLILKDSRLGAFGAMGVAFTLLGLTTLATALCQQNTLWPLVLAPALGRSMVNLLLLLAPMQQGSTLGKLLALGRSKSLCALQLIAMGLLISLFFSPTVLLNVTILLALALTPLVRLGRRENGMNGDFLGAGILVSELCLLLACLA